MFILIYYLVLPFIAAWVVLRFIRKYGPPPVAPDVAALYASTPIEKKWFRTLRRDSAGLKSLGDFEKQPEAVECAYRTREAAQGKEKAAFLVANDKGEILEEIDS